MMECKAFHMDAALQVSTHIPGMDMGNIIKQASHSRITSGSERVLCGCGNWWPGRWRL